MTIVANPLDNAGFIAIARSPLLEPMYIISQGKTPLQMDVAAAMLSLFIWGYFALFCLVLLFLVIVFEYMYCL